VPGWRIDKLSKNVSEAAELTEAIITREGG
jgi:hypothetical protein